MPAEVADLPAPGDVVLLGVQAEVVAQGEEPLEQFPRLALAAVERERFDQPKGAGCDGLQARYLTSAEKPLRTAPYRDLPRPGRGR
jgi:hypothetical protein